MTWSYTLALWVALACIAFGLGGAGCAVPHKYTKAEALERPRNCFEHLGQLVQAQGTECPDHATYAAEQKWWLSRVNESHPYLLSGTTVIFIDGELTCSFCKRRDGLTFVHEGRVTAIANSYAVWGHEMCHVAKTVLGQDGSHRYRPGVWPRKKTAKDEFIYAVCEAAGSDAKKLSHPLTSEKYP